MNDHESLYFAGFFGIFLILASICSCIDRVTNGRLNRTNSLDDISIYNLENNNEADNVSIPPKYEEIYETN